MDSWLGIPGFGFLRLDSWVWIPGFGFLGLDSWVWIPGFGVLGIWIPGLGFLGLESWVGVLGLDFWIWTPGLNLTDGCAETYDSGPVWQSMGSPPRRVEQDWGKAARKPVLKRNPFITRDITVVEWIGGDSFNTTYTNRLSKNPSR